MKTQSNTRSTMPDDVTLILLRYTIQPGRVAEREAAVREWVGAIRALNDPEIRYAVYCAPDGVSFAYWMGFASEAALRRVDTLPAFAAFRQGTVARAEGGAVTATRLSNMTLLAQAEAGLKTDSDTP